MGQLESVSISDFRRFLISKGLVLKNTSGGHEIWSKDGMRRPVVLQTHVDPVPRDHITTNLNSMQASRSDLQSFLGSKKQQKALKKKQ